MARATRTSPVKSNILTSKTPVKRTRNLAGGVAFTLPAKERLASRILTSLVNEKKFYGDNTAELLADLREVGKSDPRFLLKLCSYARDIFHMRSAPIFTLSHASLIDEVKPFVRQWTPFIVRRADEPAEVIATLNQFFTDQGVKPVIPNSIKRGLADALTRFNAYNLTKYKGLGRPVNLFDVFNICHPVPKDQKQAEMWRKFMTGEIKTARTWESTISAAGQDKEKGVTAQDWEKIIPEMGYMALLRNIRNFEGYGVSASTLQSVYDRIANPEEVRKSKQFPFRFLSAYNQVRSKGAKDALSKAIEASVANVEKLRGKTVVIIDLSGSMDSPLSTDSSVSYKNISSVLGALVTKVSDDAEIIVFACTAERFDSHGYSSILRLAQSIMSRNVGGSTNAWLAFDVMNVMGIRADRIILLSDMQCYNSCGWNGGTVAQKWDEYRKMNPNCWFHSVDLAGYGTSQAPVSQKNVALYAGWTEKFLELVQLQEKGASGLVKEIEMYDPMKAEVEEVVETEAE